MTTALTPNFKIKDPSEVLVYEMDWAGSPADGGPWLASGVTIITSTWSIVNVSTVAAWSGVTAYVVGNQVLSGGVIYEAILANTNQVPPAATYWDVVDASPLTFDQASIVAGARSTRLRLSAGTNHTRYHVMNHITTSETPSQQGERTFELFVQNR